MTQKIKAKREMTNLYTQKNNNKKTTANCAGRDSLGLEDSSQSIEAAISHLLLSCVAAVNDPVQQALHVRVEVQQQVHRLLGQLIDLPHR